LKWQSSLSIIHRKMSSNRIADDSWYAVMCFIYSILHFLTID